MANKKHIVDYQYRNAILSFLSKKRKTQVWLSSLTGISTTSINNFCSGKRQPHYTQIAKIINAGLEPKELFKHIEVKKWKSK